MNRARGTDAVTIETGTVRLCADVTFPGGEIQGVVLFAHGSGSSRLSPRNRGLPGCWCGMAWSPCCWTC